DSAQLSGPKAAPDAAGPAAAPADTGAWTAARREVRVPGAPTSRVLVVPESVNPGWLARTANGSRLVPVAVNGWQQGWVLPADTAGTITLTFGSNRLYRVGLAVGLALLPLLALLAWWPARRRPRDDAPAQPWTPRRWQAVAAGLGIGAVIAGLTGIAVFGAALGLLYGLRHRQRWYAAATLGLSSGGLIAAGAVLTRHPWRSVDGYAGHSASVQLLALISVAVLTASAVVPAVRSAVERHRGG
ncbi:MAG TPA: hypothetical protein VFQ37_17390, partial [Mycobacterium sp.]|nr:hypothetical protein [Mycobacterium sp.]